MTKISNWSDDGQARASGSGGTFAKSRRLAPKLAGGPLPHFFSSLPMTNDPPKNKTGKVLLTALAGAGVGALAGVLLYSKNGIERRRKFRNLRLDHRLRLRGDWTLLKGKLQREYSQLTEEDLAYVEGKGHELVSRLQAKLGKRKRQIVKMLNAL